MYIRQLLSSHFISLKGQLQTVQPCFYNCNVLSMLYGLNQFVVLINKEIPKVTYYYVLILNLNLKCIINFLTVISISMTLPGKTGRVV